MRIGLYGVSRSGKNYLINKIQESIDISSINGSNVLSEIAGVSIEEFKNLHKREKNLCRRRLIDKLRKDFPTEDLIIDGHYCFIESKGKYDIVFTEEDLDFYDIFIYLDTPADTILDRLRLSSGFRKNVSITKDEIEEWKSYEIEELQRLCRTVDKDLIILDQDIESILQWIKLILDKNIRTSSLAIAKDIIETNKYTLDKYKKILLLDCDKTLSYNDSTLNFFEHVNFDKQLLKNTFNKDRYSLYQFNKIANQYSLLKKTDYDFYCKKVAKEDIKLASDTIEYLKEEYSDFLAIGITSGIKDIWVNIQNYIKFPDLIIGGSYFPHDRYIISDDVKRIVAKILRDRGYYVVALGDSMIDIPMLYEANKGYIVAYERLNKSVQRELLYNKRINIKQWVFSKQHYKNTPVMGRDELWLKNID